uniref:Transposase n=1 Tax=Panagrellus redivivus TaxID=6233 RepID=A0A7E4URE0_PANRE
MIALFGWTCLNRSRRHLWFFAPVCNALRSCICHLMPDLWHRSACGWLVLFCWLSPQPSSLISLFSHQRLFGCYCPVLTDCSDASRLHVSHRMLPLHQRRKLDIDDHPEAWRVSEATPRLIQRHPAVIVVILVMSEPSNHPGSRLADQKPFMSAVWLELAFRCPKSASLVAAKVAMSRLPVVWLVLCFSMYNLLLIRGFAAPKTAVSSRLALSSATQPIGDGAFT